MSRYPDDKMGMTNEFNPNRGGPIHSAPDTIDPRFNARGRADSNGLGTFKDRLQAQIEKPGVEVSYCPGINIKSTIEPSQELGRAWLKGLEFGEGHRD